MHYALLFVCHVLGVRKLRGSERSDARNDLSEKAEKQLESGRAFGNHASD